MFKKSKDINSPEIKSRKVTNPLTKGILIGIGVLCVGIGILGIFLPVLPTTPFLLLAAASFIRSSDRFYHRLINNRYLGAYIRNYREKRGMTLKLKLFSITLLWLTILYSAFFAVDTLWISIVLLAIAVTVTTHILMLRTLKK